MLFGIMEKKKTQESGNYETNAVWDNGTESDVSKVETVQTMLFWIKAQNQTSGK